MAARRATTRPSDPERTHLSLVARSVLVVLGNGHYSPWAAGSALTRYRHLSLVLSMPVNRPRLTRNLMLSGRHDSGVGREIQRYGLRCL